MCGGDYSPQKYRIRHQEMLSGTFLCIVIRNLPSERILFKNSPTCTIGNDKNRWYTVNI